jgi:hypothetical protein
MRILNEAQRIKRREYAREWMRRRRAPVVDEDDLPIAPGPRPRMYRDIMRDERRKTSVHARFDDKITELMQAGRILV